MTLTPSDLLANLVTDLAQVLWQEYAATCGRSMPTGMADHLAAAAVTHLGLAAETRTLTNGWVQPLFSAHQARTWANLTGQPYEAPPAPTIEEQHRFLTTWEPTL